MEAAPDLSYPSNCSLTFDMGTSSSHGATGREGSIRSHSGTPYSSNQPGGDRGRYATLQDGDIDSSPALGGNGTARNSLSSII